MDEIWKPAIKCEDRYEVSNLGRLRSVTRSAVDRRGYRRVYESRILTLTLQHKGYLQTTVRCAEAPRNYQIHLAVAHAFVEGRTAERWQVNHKDGIKTNNVWTNLEWVTPSENGLHAIKNGLVKALGERHPRARLSEATVRRIASEAAAGRAPARIAKDLGLPDTTVHSVLNGQTWKHVTGFEKRSALRGVKRESVRDVAA